MSLLIKGMGMPNLGYREIRIYPDGRVMEEDECGIDEVVGTAEKVQSHGSLIEKNDVFKLIASFPDVDKRLPVEFMKALYELPTIIQAEDGK